MTFDQWYNSTIAPTIPRDMPAGAQAVARALMVACWNAALENGVYALMHAGDHTGVTNINMRETLDSLKVKTI